MSTPGMHLSANDVGLFPAERIPVLATPCTEVTNKMSNFTNEHESASRSALLHFCGIPVGRKILSGDILCKDRARVCYSRLDVS